MVLDQSSPSSKTVSLAPSSSARSSFHWCRDVTIVVQPKCFAILNEASAAPPPIPVISTVCPARSCVRVTSMRHAVRWLSANAAASMGSASPISRTFSTGAMNCSAFAPLSCSPIIRMSSGEGEYPGRTFSGWRTAAFSNTRFPIQSLSTPSPTSMTIPQPSEPLTLGYSNASPGMPFPTHKSKWLSAEASVFTRTSLAASAGNFQFETNATLLATGVPSCETTAAFMKFQLVHF